MKLKIKIKGLMKCKIKNKFINTHPNYIKFELDNYIEFNNGKQNFIFCVNEHPFINYQIGDEVEVDLNITKLVSAYHINQQGIARKVSKNVSEDIIMGDYISQQEDNERLRRFQVQEQITLLVSAYDKKATHKSFRGSLEWTEKYIEVVHGEDYPDWQTRKKIHDKSIKRQDANDQNRVKRLLSSKLLGFKSMIEVISGDKQSKQFLCDEIKKEYYEWLDAVGINPNDCPSELKHYLFEINEILEGRGDKLERDMENKKQEIDPNSVEYEEAFNKLFTDIGVPLDNEREEYEKLKGKNQKDIKITNNFGGNSEPAEQAFKQMAGRHDYQGFYFVPQKDSQSNPQTGSSGSSRSTDFQQRPNSVIIRNVRQNPNDWRLDEVIINGERRMALIHHSVQSEVVDLNSQPVYLPQKFNQAEIEEIKQFLGIRESSSPVQASNPKPKIPYLSENNELIIGDEVYEEAGNIPLSQQDANSIRHQQQTLSSGSQSLLAIGGGFIALVAKLGSTRFFKKTNR